MWSFSRGETGRYPVIPSRPKETVPGLRLAEAGRSVREQTVDLVTCLSSDDDECVRVARKQGFVPPTRKAGLRKWRFVFS
jgi:hypothetical protein